MLHLQNVATLHPSLQLGSLSVLNTSLTSTSSAAGPVHASPEQLTALLQLLQQPDASSALSEMAYITAQRYLEQAVDFENMSEVHLWLDCLPKASAEASRLRRAACLQSCSHVLW